MYNLSSESLVQVLKSSSRFWICVWSHLSWDMLGEMGFAKIGLVPSSASGGKLCRLEYHLFITFIIERFGHAQFLNSLRGRVEWGAELPQLWSITAAELGCDAFGYSKVLLWLEDQAQNSLKFREWALFFSTSVSRGLLQVRYLLQLAAYVVHCAHVQQNYSTPPNCWGLCASELSGPFLLVGLSQLVDCWARRGHGC